MLKLVLTKLITDMKKAKVLFFLLSLALATDAQKAPDFTILDYNNETHQLYEDYLDQGQAVVLKIMFVACPPCNIVAPQIQDLYEEFGSGMEDVQFIELSNKNWDDNAAMKGFAEKHSLTFPGAGADGGSLSAVSPYTSGTYGRFLGTPTFVVIDADGNVNYNVPLQDLKAAIEDATGGSGCSNQFGGTIDSPNDSAIVQLVSDIAGAQVFTMDLNMDNEYEYDCQFTFPPQGFDYFVTVEQDGNDIAGVSIKDIVQLLRHLLAITPLTTTEEKIAADFTANGVLSVRDISEIRKLILGTYGENPHHNSYIFYHETSDFSQDTSGILIPDLIHRVPLMDVVDSVLTGNFAGIKLGDISGDINSFFNKNVTRSPEVISMDVETIEEGLQFTSYINIPQELDGFQFCLDLPGDVTSVSTDDFDQLGWNGQDGEVRILGYTSNARTNGNSSTRIKIQWTPDQLNNIDIRLAHAIPATGMLEDQEYHLTLQEKEASTRPLLIRPNPVSGEDVTIFLSREMSQIQLMDISGKVVSSFNMPLSNGEHSVRLPNPAGVYILVAADLEGNSFQQKIIRR